MNTGINVIVHILSKCQITPYFIFFTLYYTFLSHLLKIPSQQANAAEFSTNLSWFMVNRLTYLLGLTSWRLMYVLDQRSDRVGRGKRSVPPYFWDLAPPMRAFNTFWLGNANWTYVFTEKQLLTRTARSFVVWDQKRYVTLTSVLSWWANCVCYRRKALAVDSTWLTETSWDTRRSCFVVGHKSSLTSTLSTCAASARCWRLITRWIHDIGLAV